MKAEVAWQPLLVAEPDAVEPRVDSTYAGLQRIELDATSWVDYCPGWLSGSDEVFAQLAAAGSWRQRTVWMYERRVLEPRLTSGWSTDAAESDVPPVLRLLAGPLSDRYGVAFDRVWVNLYRDGHDSVAWHGDRNRQVMTCPLVATVSLGARRRFVLRRRGTSRVEHELRPGVGDLVVMGGRCQHDWEHAVPKTARPVGPRMSVTIRHSQPAPGERMLGNGSFDEYVARRRG